MVLALLEFLSETLAVFELVKVRGNGMCTSWAWMITDVSGCGEERRATENLPIAFNSAHALSQALASREEM
jgi:hypothetical protein